MYSILLIRERSRFKDIPTLLKTIFRTFGRESENEQSGSKTELSIASVCTWESLVQINNNDN